MELATRRRAWAVARIFMLCLTLTGVASALSVAGASAAEKSWIHLEASASGSQVTVKAVLFNEKSQPIKDRQIVVTSSLGGSANGKTDNSGWTTIQLSLPDSAASGQVTITASFAGDDKFAPVSGQATVKYDSTITPKITINSGPKQFRPGDLITITGTVADQANKPLQGLAIEATITTVPENGESVVTDAAGKFTTLVQVPDNQPVGAMSIKVWFDGGDRIQATSTNVSYEIKPAPTPTPTPTTAAPSATPTPTTPASPAASGKVTTAATGSTSATPVPAKPVQRNLKPAIALGLTALVAVGGSLGIAALARSRADARRAADDAEVTDRLIDDR